MTMRNPSEKGWRAAAAAITRSGEGEVNRSLVLPLILIALVTLFMLAAVIKPI